LQYEREKNKQRERDQGAKLDGAAVPLWLFEPHY